MIEPKDELLFLALGGAGEIGMNLNLYGYGGKWIMLDCGVTFGDDRAPGVDVLLPGPALIVERRDKLAGLVVTHAHEDHLGAIPYIWDRLRCPVYATPFAAAVLRAKLEEASFDDEVPITVVPMSGKFSVGPFELELITLTHSIPEPNAVVLRTPVGTVLHTGDWKLDPDPVVGPTADEAALRRLGDEGVLAMICDSTNALRPGESGSEADVRDSLMKLIGQFQHRIAVACFASNVARLRSISEAARQHGRDVALVGRSLWRIEQAARATGYLDGLPPFLTEDEAGYLPRDKALYICTGSQGEPRSALARIARDDHAHITLEPGDVVIFSSRVIPGNELAIGRLQNDLAQLGVEIITDADAFVHVSGHPARDELVRMYQLVRPKVAVPVHGEARHLLSHARLAEECQVQQALVIDNGDVVRLGPGPAAILDDVPTGRLGVEGQRLLVIGEGALRSRQRMVFNGAAVATVVLDRSGEMLASPKISAPGLVEEGDPLIEDLMDAVEEAVRGLAPHERRIDAAVHEATRIAVRRVLRAAFGKKPITDVHVVRV
jgi:ribonuclease J